MTLLSVKQVLAEVKRSCSARFSLLYPHLLLNTKEVLAVLGRGDVTKVPGADPSCWELIYSEFSNFFEKQGTPPERAINHEIDLPPDSVPPAKRYYRISPVELAELRKQLDEYLSKGLIRPSTSLYGVLVLFARKKDGNPKMSINYWALSQQERPDKYPLRRIDNLLDRLVNAYFLTSIDLHTIYYQVAMHPGDVYKTVFLSSYG